MVESIAQLEGVMAQNAIFAKLAFQREINLLKL